MKAIEWKEQKEGDRKRKHADGDKKPAAGKGTQKQMKSPERAEPTGAAGEVLPSGISRLSGEG